MRNCDCEKEESGFVSGTIKTSVISLIILDNISDNILLMELVFKCPITTQLTLFGRTFSKTSKKASYHHQLVELGGSSVIYLETKLLQSFKNETF